MVEKGRAPAGRGLPFLLMALSLLCSFEGATAASSAASRPARRDGRGMDAHGVFLPRLRNSLRSDSPRLSRNTPYASGKRGCSLTPMERCAASGFSPGHVVAVHVELGSIDVALGGQKQGCTVLCGWRGSARSSHCPSNPDSGHPGEAVCSLPMCRMGRMSPPSCRLLLFLSCYLALRVVPASKQ